MSMCMCICMYLKGWRRGRGGKEEGEGERERKSTEDSKTYVHCKQHRITHFYTWSVVTVDLCCHNITSLYAQEPSMKFCYEWEREKNSSYISHRMRTGVGVKGNDQGGKKDIQNVFIASTACFSRKMDYASDMYADCLCNTTTHMFPMLMVQIITCWQALSKSSAIISAGYIGLILIAV